MREPYRANESSPLNEPEGQNEWQSTNEPYKANESLVMREIEHRERVDEVDSTEYKERAVGTDSTDDRERTNQNDRREQHMNRQPSVLIAILGLLVAFPATAAADHAPEWVANQDSFVVDPTTAHLEGDNTSIETGDELWNLAAGDEVSFDYVLHDGALCEAGAPRVFVQPNGITNHSHHCDGVGSPDTNGSVSFTVDDAGLVERVGLVYDSGRPGYVEISNLVIGGELVHFANPEPEPEPCEWNDELAATDDKCVEPEDETDENDSEETKPESESDAKRDESESDDDTTPASTTETLPETGASTVVWLVVLGAALILFGIGAIVLRRT